MTVEEETKILEEIHKEIMGRGRLLYSYEIRRVLDQFLKETSGETERPQGDGIFRVANHLRDRIKDINHEIMIPQSNESKCILDGKRKAFQYVLDLLEVKGEKE